MKNWNLGKGGENMTISDLREAMNMDMEVSFDYKGINYFIEPDAKSDKWMVFCSLKPDVPSFMTMNEVLDMKIDDMPLKEVLPLVTNAIY